MPDPSTPDYRQRERRTDPTEKREFSKAEAPDTSSLVEAYRSLFRQADDRQERAS